MDKKSRMTIKRSDDSYSPHEDFCLGDVDLEERDVTEPRLLPWTQVPSRFEAYSRLFGVVDVGSSCVCSVASQQIYPPPSPTLTEIQRVSCRANTARRKFLHSIAWGTSHGAGGQSGVSDICRN